VISTFAPRKAANRTSDRSEVGCTTLTLHGLTLVSFVREA
jgi:hypothetical protein